MNLGLTDHVAFVAGASAGLGYAVAERLAHEGMQVALCSRSQKHIEGAAACIAEGMEQPDAEARLHPVVCDVTDPAAVDAAVTSTVERFGALHVLVPNAGGPPSGTASSFSLDDWQEALDLNLKSTISMCQAALPHLKDAAAETLARIVIVASVSAKQPIPTLALSNTARAGVLGYAKSLAAELGPTGITVNTVLPGYTKTARLDELAESKAAKTGQSRDAIEADWADANALDRLGRPDEFAAAVAFLASQWGGYITGTALPVDGGRSQHLL